MNPKIPKTIAEIEKAKMKIAEAQERISQLEAQLVDLENTEVIAAYRSINLTPDEFAAFLKSYRAGGNAALAVSVAPNSMPPTVRPQEVNDQ